MSIKKVIGGLMMSTIPISVIALMVWVMGPVPVLFGFGILAWCLVSIWLLVTG